MPNEILILSPFHLPNHGGAETFLENLEQEAKKCHHITVLTYQPLQKCTLKYEESYYPKGSINIYRMNWWFKPGNVWKGVSLRNAFLVFPKMALLSLCLLMKKRYKIVHGQGLLSGLIAVLLKKIFRCKAYITLLALYEFKDKPQWFQSICRWIFLNSDCVFVEGLSGEQDMWSCFYSKLKHMGDIKKFKVNVKQFNHWVDQSIFYPPENRPNDKIRVLFIGRPIPEKGKHIVEEAERLLNDKEKYEFIYVEDVEYKDLPHYYQMADICVVPSLYSEGYSRVVAESASCGCAVITSDRGSLPEMVRGWGAIFNSTVRGLIDTIEFADHKKGQFQSIEYSKQKFSKKNSEVFINAYN